VPRLVVVRHGETDWSRSGRHTSTTDVALTPAGEEAARQLAARLAGMRFAAVLCSPRGRAQRTAQLAGFGHATVEPLLAEWDYGAYEGITTAKIRETQPGWSIWDSDPSGGETADAVGERADRVIAHLRALDGDSLVFSHAHFLRVLAARWLGSPASFGRHFALSTASVGMLGWQREDSVIELWNDTAHMDAAPRGDWDREQPDSETATSASA
jgi:broad specificity phosphatase PhoE